MPESGQTGTTSEAPAPAAAPDREREAGEGAHERRSLVSPDMLERKGVWGRETVSPPVAESDIRKWAIATYWPEAPPPIYWDAVYAKTTRYGSIIAPPDFNPFAWAIERYTGGARGSAGAGRSRDTDSRARRSRPGGTRRLTVMNGGQTDTYGVPILPGDVITARSRLVDWEERQGRLGLTLFVHTETLWTNQKGERVRRRLSTTIRY